MKKTIITLLALSGLTLSADPVELTAVTNQGGTHLSDVSGRGYMYQLWDQSGETRPEKNPGLAHGDNTLSTIKTEGDNKFILKFASASSFNILDSLYFHQIIKNNESTTLSLNFSSTGSLTAADSVNFGQGTTSITLSATLTEEQLNNVKSSHSDTPLVLFERNLIISSSRKLWNFYDYDRGAGLSDIEELTKLGYSNRGFINSTTNTYEPLKAGEYALLYKVTDDKAMATLVVMSAAPIPEPTTATLSLLALVGLAARRRRR